MHRSNHPKEELCALANSSAASGRKHAATMSVPTTTNKIAALNDAVEHSAKYLGAAEHSEALWSAQALGDTSHNHNHMGAHDKIPQALWIANKHKTVLKIVYKVKISPCYH